MADSMDRLISNATQLANPRVLGEKLNLGPVGLLLFTRFSGPALLFALRWARRHPTVAIGSAALIGAGFFLQQKKNFNAAQRIAAT